MPVRRTSKGWMMGTSGPYKSKGAAERAQRAYHAKKNKQRRKR
jgi:hypothetical protein